MIEEFSPLLDASPELNEMLRKLFQRALPYDTSTAPAQGDVIYFDGDNWLALTAGTSGHYFKTQGASANPQWAALSCAVGNFTRDTTAASGTQEITGVGFTPVAVIFLAVEVSAKEMTVGFTDGTNHFSIATDDGVTADEWDKDTSRFIFLKEGAGVAYAGTSISFDSDGFTITWTKVGSPSGTLTGGYIALG